MSEKVSTLLKRNHCTGHHCGICAYWSTDMMKDGEYCGWIGTCNHPNLDTCQIEADDYCSKFELTPVYRPGERGEE